MKKAVIRLAVLNCLLVVCACSRDDKEDAVAIPEKPQKAVEQVPFVLTSGFLDASQTFYNESGDSIIIRKSYEKLYEKDSVFQMAVLIGEKEFDYLLIIRGNKLFRYFEDDNEVKLVRNFDEMKKRPHFEDRLPEMKNMQLIDEDSVKLRAEDNAFRLIPNMRFTITDNRIYADYCKRRDPIEYLEFDERSKLYAVRTAIGHEVWYVRK